MKERITAVLIATSMAWGTQAIAQQAQTPNPAPSTPHSSPAAQNQGQGAAQSAISFQDEDLQKYAELQKPIQEIRNDYSKRLESTQKPEEAADLQKEATDKMVEVVRDSGLEVQTYNQIAVALQSNPQLQAKVKSMMN